MLIFKLALRNLLRNRRKTLLLGVLIAVGMAFLFFANAIFESSNQGVKNSFVNSLTGDIVLGAKSDTVFSLFGNEIPVIDDYEVIPSIAEYSDMSEVFDKFENIESYSPIVAAASAVEIEDFRSTASLFGIVPQSYFNVCSEIKIDKGDPEDIDRGGIFLCAPFLAEAEKKLGRKIRIGEEVKLSLYSNGSFKIRKGFFAGSHSYVNQSAPFDEIVLADPGIVRALIDYTAGSVAEDASHQTETTGTELDFDIDELFAEAEDTVSRKDNDELSLSDIEAIIADTSERDSVLAVGTSAWSFVIFRAKNDKIFPLRQELAEAAENNLWDVEIKSWRKAAGISAQAVFALQAAFNVGIVFIIIGAILVIMNALVISVLERSFEIGTMRAIGAGKSFIRSLFITESMMLTMSGAVVGITAGVVISFLFSRGIVLHNGLLITLFGGNVICPSIEIKSILFHLAGAAAIGALSWVYPVSVAVKIEPVSIMGRK